MTHLPPPSCLRAFVPACLGLLLLALAPAALAQAPDNPKPNFIIIFCDDLGYGDLGCYGSDVIATPNLDRMAAEGIKLTDFHTCSPVCSPSRAALLTGSYAARIGLEKHVLFPHSKIGLSPSEITIARLLKGQGYATTCIGKWHVGDRPGFLPTDHGFDSYFGIPYSNDMNCKIDDKLGPPLMRNDKVIEHPAKQATLTERYTDEAISFITTNKDRPFFLYLPHWAPHVPLHVSEKFAKQSKRGLYGDVVQCVDWSAGQILETLKKLSLDEKTLVVFTSDNGPWLIMKENGGSAGPLRDGKGTIYEGGHRVPCIVRWPGRIPAGKVSNELTLTMDLYPTIARLAGATVPADRVIDGRDIWPIITSQPGAKTPHPAFFHHSAMGPLQAVRSGPWKLILPRKEQVRKDGKPVTVDRPLELYNLDQDLAEKKNIAAENPEIVDRLTKLAQGHLDDLAKNSRPVGRIKETTPDTRPDRGFNDRR